MNSVATF